MKQQKNPDVEHDELTFIKLFLLVKASFGNIIKSTLACILVVGAYYFFVPNVFKASATIELAIVAGKPVEAPSVLLEKIKLLHYFSNSTLQLCGSVGETDSQAKFVDKIRPSANRVAPFVSFVTQAKSTYAAKACMESVISEVLSNQDAIAKPLIEHKKQKIRQLNERLELAEGMAKTFPASKRYNNPADEQFSARNIVMLYSAINAQEIYKLRGEIVDLENELIAPQTKKATLVGSIYAPEAPNNEPPFFALMLCLALGLILGLLLTGVARVMPVIWLQIRETEKRANR